MFKKILKISSLILGIVILMIIISVITINLVKKDDGSYAPNTELLPQDISVSEKENAYFDLAQIKIKGEGPEDFVKKYIQDGEWDISEARKLVEDNQETLRIFDLANTKSKYQNPANSEIDNDESEVKMMTINKFQTASEISAIKALLLMKDKEDELAFAEAYKSIHVGHVIMTANGNQAEYMIGMAIKNVGLETMRKISAATRLTSDDLESYVKKLNTIPNNINDYSIKKQYSETIEKIDALKKGDMVILEKHKAAKTYNLLFKVPYLFMPNKTKKIIENRYMDEIVATRKTCGSKDLPPTENMDKTEKSILTKFENMLGRTIAETSITNKANSIRGEICKQKVLQNATILSLAAKAHYNDNKSPFESLEELIPDYIEEIPLDPYTNKPMLYSLEKKIAYSQGKNGLDIGGELGMDWEKMANPSFDLNFISSIPPETSSSSTASSTDDIINQDGETNATSSPAQEDNKNTTQDTDQDGLTDQEELNQYHTNPNKADTDNDTYSDGDEIKNGYNPNGDGRL